MDRSYFVIRFIAPIVSVSPPYTSYTYTASLEIPPISSLLGAIIAALDRTMDPEKLEALGIEGAIIVGYKKAKVALRAKKFYGALIKELDLSIGVAPTPGKVYVKGGVLRRILMTLKEKKKLSTNALTREYSFTYSFDVAIGAKSEFIDDLKNAVRSITRIGDTESLVSVREVFEASRGSSYRGLGMLPLEFVEPIGEYMLDRASIRGQEPGWDLFAISLKAAKRRGIAVYEPSEISVKEEYRDKVEPIVYKDASGEHTILAIRLSSIRKAKKRRR